VRQADDLSASLREFESGRDDVGWLGTGLHDPRPGAKPFDFGAVALAVLYTGPEAGSWDAPGVAQRIADELVPSRLGYLGLGAPWATEAEQGWGGAATSLYVRDDHAWCIELAKAIAGTISRPGHEVSAKPIAASDMRARRESKSFALLLDVVRPALPGTLGAFSSLVVAEDERRAGDAIKRAPRGEVSLRSLCRSTRSGVVGDVRVQGGRAADVALYAGPAFGIDWARAARGKAPRS
jgi:peptide/nickel transport system substrate-binding protein